MADMVSFALQDSLSTLARRESWGLMSARVDATAAPLSPRPCREVQPEMPPNRQAGWLP